MMKIPTCEIAKNLLAEAAQLNPGPWVQHSLYAAEAARAIATYHPQLEPDAAFTLGCLHDIGRRFGVTDMRHVLDGYTFLAELGFDDAAQICLTHSFVIKDVNSGAGKWDCTAQELEFVRAYIATVQYTDYDSLIQLCDSIALPSGFCLMEKRLVDVALRHGFNDYTLERWRLYQSIRQQIEEVIGRSVYSILPGVIENTFGISVTALETT